MNAHDMAIMVPAGRVLLWLAQEDGKHHADQTSEQCLQAAIRTVLDRLLDKNLIAWAHEVHIDCEFPELGFPPGKLINPADMLTQTQFARVPLDFWCDFHNALPDRRSANAVTGDFKFKYNRNDDSGWRDGKAYGVMFETAGVDTLGYVGSVAEAKPFAVSAATRQPKFNDQERKAWISDHPMKRADDAFVIYQNEPRYCGTKRREFRVEWREIKGTKRGRPEGK